MPTTLTLSGAGAPGPVTRFFRRVGLGRDDRDQWLGCPPGVGCLPRGQLGDAWSDDAAAAGTGDNAIADFTTAAVGWGVLAFAVGTAVIRGYGAGSRFLKR
jgi:hypothetical protein